ncbi:MAG: radical SAM protein [Deltaproteobacteria bacterium]|nr:radical SAM protein [Deltaproteobacteria bacterium]MBW2016146.1 radical SAM protein [Deltaproteobacteria bacterium]MBW2127759.1 radical SAM protein [Deltaproteobacteria bacterium]MBW2303182.1 radical SAM protein [Deltaproteobacteria bacterium]
MSHVFGPVPSRRLGLSLGVDLVPRKTCTFDCLYCQVGRTTRKIIEPGSLVPIEPVIDELRKSLETVSPDAVTFSGSGEPTLHSGIGRIMEAVRKMTETKIALLTNGSLLWKKDIREGILSADTIMPTLSSANEETFRTIHRPHPDLGLQLIITGLHALRKEFKGEFALEVILLAGLNDSDREIEGLKEVIDGLSPDRIQLNTVARPPADAGALPLDMPRLEKIKSFLGERSEIIADVSFAKGHDRRYRLAADVLEMALRRPVRAEDVARTQGIRAQEAESILEGLVHKGRLSRENHGGDVFYVSSSLKA